jgi:uncharacterized protein YuzE
VVSVTYDESGKSLYIDLEKGLKISKTIPMGEGKYMDVSEDDQAIGLEIIFAKSTPDEVLNAIFAGNTPKEIREAVSMMKVPIKLLAK